jgi:GNAT superfamily N-acetyltransferase
MGVAAQADRMRKHWIMHTRLRTGELIEITTLAERPYLEGAEVDVGEWPEFMRHNRISDAYFWQSCGVFPETCLVATGKDGSVVANAHAVQFLSGGAGRNALPAGGWEQVVVWAFADAVQEITPDTACALSISVAASYQGQGLARLMLGSLRDAARELGLASLVAPVRPTWKDHEPRTPMAEYAGRTREDRLPYDPWLRTHVRAGGEIVSVAPTSWLVAGSLPEWREWTGLPFDGDGEVDVPGALVPVHCDIHAGWAVYVEPNVWVRHCLRSCGSL